MPYVLKHTQTGEIATAVLRNVYDLDYFGAEWWDDLQEAQRTAEHRAGWEPIRVEDSRLKLMNVKLNNDMSRKLYEDDSGSLRTKKGSAE